MKSFIVTFYRHGGKEDPALFLGTIEDAGAADVKKFTSLDELYAFLGSAGARWKSKTIRQKDRAINGGMRDEIEGYRKKILG